MIEIIAWSLIGFILFTFVGFPMLTIALAGLMPARPWHGGSHVNMAEPSVSILIGAYNEEAHISDKLDSVLAACAHYRGQVTIHVGDDGSSDNTAACVEFYRDRGVKLLSLPRGGKAAALNAMVPQSTGEILVFTDADPLFEADTLRQLVAPFTDGQVGAVAGEVVSVKQTGTGTGRFGGLDRLYRNYESALREAEDRLCGCVSADGGLLAIRRELMPVVPDDGTDDFHISTAAVAGGKRIAFNRHARVLEHPIIGERKTMRRRIRITVRGLTALWRRRALLNPMRTGGYALALFFHKFCRRLAPLLILPLALCVVSLALAGKPFWVLVAVGMAGLALSALLGSVAGDRLPRIVGIGYVLGIHLFGLAAGFCLFMTGRRYRQWTPQKTNG